MSGFFAVAATLSAVASARATDPTTADCLAANENSIALRREFKLRAARAELLTCAAASCPADVRKECSRRVEDVNAAMPTIVFEVKDANGTDLSAVRVTLDGQPLAERLEGTAISIDPGSHVFFFEGNGYAPVQKTFVIREGEKERRELITLQVRVSAPAPTTALGPTPTMALGPAPTSEAGASLSASTSSSALAPADRPLRRTTSPLPVVGLVSAGVGVVGLGVGAVFGLKAKSDYDDSNRNGHCDASGCDGQGLKARNDAFSAARVSTGFFVAGGVLAAGGIALYFVGKSSTERAAPSASLTPVISERSGGLFVHGRF